MGDGPQTSECINSRGEEVVEKEGEKGNLCDLAKQQLWQVFNFGEVQGKCAW